MHGWILTDRLPGCNDLPGKAEPRRAEREAALAPLQIGGIRHVTGCHHLYYPEEARLFKDCQLLNVVL